MKYLFIAQHKKTWPVDLMCQLLGVTRSGYYGHQRRGCDSTDYYHQEMLEAVRDIAKATEDMIGSHIFIEGWRGNLLDLYSTFCYKVKKVRHSVRIKDIVNLLC